MEQLLENKRVLVIGLGASGMAACDLLKCRGALIRAMDSADTPDLRERAARLQARGIAVTLGATTLDDGPVDLAVLSPGVPNDIPLMRALADRKTPVIGELELGYRHSLCPNIAVTGTNGKTTTTELVERLLAHHQIKTLAAGNIGVPLCAVAGQTQDLDFLTLEVSSFQLETIQFFRPAIAVLLNLTPDHLDRYARMSDYVNAKGRLFMNQQWYDWAIIQSEALEQLRLRKVALPSRMITFSANQRRADIYLDGGVLTSRLPDRPGPLLELGQCQLRGPHNAENLMAALAVGQVLRLPLARTVEALTSHAAAAHRGEWVAEINGVTFINDSKATNVDALRQALRTIPPVRGGEPNIWLIAGGKDKGLEYHDVGPLLTQRVKGAFLLGETREKIRGSWNRFTPCTVVDSLLEAISAAAKRAVSDDVVLLSPACSSFDQFRNYQHRGDVFREAVRALRPSRPLGRRSKGRKTTGVDRNVKVKI